MTTRFKCKRPFKNGVTPKMPNFRPLSPNVNNMIKDLWNLFIIFYLHVWNQPNTWHNITTEMLTKVQLLPRWPKTKEKWKLIHNFFGVYVTIYMYPRPLYATCCHYFWVPPSPPPPPRDFIFNGTWVIKPRDRALFFKGRFSISVVVQMVVSIFIPDFLILKC